MLFINSCSTDKSTFLTRAFHNTTSHFNGYFNAREIIRETEKNLKEQHVDDYSQLLPIFIYPDEQQSQALYPAMDKVIEKCSEVIERHSIYIRNKEHVKWIDDSYFLIGKARFYKHEYELARETFLYIYQAYKKEPIRYEGLLWLIRTHTEMRNWDEVRKFIEIVEDDKKFPEELKGEYNAVYADFLLKSQADYRAASEKLEESLLHLKKKKNKIRKTYVLAQLYQALGERSSSTRLYTEVIKMRPGYTMEFNAKISRAIAFDVENNNSDDIRKQLLKMLKDDKNVDFKDQIYFALAELELKHGNKELGIDYLKKSAAASTQNVKQKALSYLRLATLYFEMPEYMEAKNYYDSTLQFLPKDHPEYYDADEKNKSLEDLVSNLKIINLQDSLLSLSKLSPKQREEFVEKLIEEKKKEEQRRILSEERKMERAEYDAERRAENAPISRSGDWYFYNATTLAFGRSEFKSIWGKRDLRDNWRWADGESVGGANAAAGGAMAEGAGPDFSSETYNPEYYLRDIPTKPAQIYASHRKLSQALFNAGTIFRESFANYPKAISSFKRITTEYDTTELSLPSHYQLYRIYMEQGNKELAEKEKEWVLENHPFSEYAYLIKNPNYNKNKQETREKIEAFYAATYNLYGYGLYEDVIQSVNKADTIFPENHIQQKFDFLRAKSIGFSRSREELRAALNDIVAQYPTDSVKIAAENILAYMNKSNTAPKKASYKATPTEQHYLIISLSAKGPEMRDLQNNLTNFNSSNFRENELNVRLVPFENKSMLLIRSFADQKDAVRYYRALKNNGNLMNQITQLQSEVFLISGSNYSILMSEKDEQAYLKFFRSKYPS